jgi:hypothetical protein
MTEIKNNERIHLSNRVRFRAFGDEGVLVNLENGRAMVVNEVGIFIVETLGCQDVTVVELAEKVTGAFEVDMNQAKADVAAFLDQLRGEQTIEIFNAPAVD